jgi:hypothetical protein
MILRYLFTDLPADHTSVHISDLHARQRQPALVTECHRFWPAFAQNAEHELRPVGAIWRKAALISARSVVMHDGPRRGTRCAWPLGRRR